MIRVYIALGSNPAQPLQQVKAALEALEHLPRTRLVTCSSFYRTKPLGPQNQPDFLNAVVALDTLLPPEQLLDHTRAIERNQGRVRRMNAGAAHARSGHHAVRRQGDPYRAPDGAALRPERARIHALPAGGNRPRPDFPRWRAARQLPQARAGKRHGAVAPAKTKS